jgi:hypothetical protein
MLVKLCVILLEQSNPKPTHLERSGYNKTKIGLLWTKYIVRLATSSSFQESSILWTGIHHFKIMKNACFKMNSQPIHNSKLWNHNISHIQNMILQINHKPQYYNPPCMHAHTPTYVHT